MKPGHIKLYNVLVYLVVLVIGIVMGFAFHVALQKFKGGKGAINYVEKHEGQYGFINPLLACDAAEDVLSDLEIRPFKRQVEAYVSTRMDPRRATKVSVYFRELNDGYWFSIGETEKFVPASLRKVPLMIALLKQAETDTSLLERRVTFDLTNDYNLNQNIKPAKILVSGNEYTIRDLIHRMIAYSDNNAFTYLTKIVNPAQLEKVYSTVHFLNPRSIENDDFLSVQTYASFFRVLYNASYLNKELSFLALDILSQSEFRTGLVAGVPQKIPVAHKFGEKSDANTNSVQLHDCGIVYFPQHPYLLCVMSQGPNFEFLDDVIAEISRITFSAIDMPR